MDDPDLILGTIVGMNFTRLPTHIGPMCKLDGVVVRLANGREVTAVMELPPLKHAFMIHTCSIGSAVKMKLGTVLEPISIVEVHDPPPSEPLC